MSGYPDKPPTCFSGEGCSQYLLPSSATTCPPSLLRCQCLSLCQAPAGGSLGFLSPVLSPTCCLSGRQHLRFDGWDLWFLLFSWECFFVPSIQTREENKTKNQSYRKHGKYVLIILANPVGKIPSNMLCG